MAGEEIKVPIGVPVETNAAEAADSIEGFRDVITSSNAEIKAMAGTLRQLRGTTDDVKAAKAQLSAKIDALKGSVSAASLALVKQGTSYDAAAAKEKKLTEQTKKLADETKKAAEIAKKDAEGKAKDRTAAMGAAIAKAGGPVASLKAKLGELKAVMGESSGASGLLTLAAAGLVAAVAAVVVGVAAGVVALSKWILTSADAARNANLLREAWSGTAQNAGNLGTQIDALANKVPTSKGALNELAISLMKARIGGQATVDAFNAIGQASAALGDQAGAKLQEFIERGKVFNKFRLNQIDFADGGLGNLGLEDVAASLAKSMGVGIKDAKKALAEGRVSLGDGAKAVRDAVEKKFGDLNLRKMMSFDVMVAKLHEKLAALTSGVKLDALLKPMSELGKLFDESTVTGSMLKKLVTEFGTGMVKAMTAAIPVAKAFFQGLVIGAFELYIGYLKLRNAARETFGDSTLFEGIDGMKVALDLGKAACYGLAAAVAITGAVVALAVAPFVLLGAAMTLPQKAGAAAVQWFKTVDWMEVGLSIPNGILAGMKAGAKFLLGGVETMAKDTKAIFAKTIGFASPAKAFIPAGKGIPQGAAVGVEQGKGELNDAIGGMASVPSGDGGGGSPIALHLHVHTGGGPSGANAAAIVSSPSFQAQLLKLFEELCLSQGVAVQT